LKKKCENTKSVENKKMLHVQCLCPLIQHLINVCKNNFELNRPDMSLKIENSKTEEIFYGNVCFVKCESNDENEIRC
jgi:hypothetical protein